MSENGLDSGSDALSIPEKPSWAALLDQQPDKFAVINNKTVITGWFDWSPSAAHTNDETLLVVHSAQLAQHFSREIYRLWDSAELGITPHIQRKLDRQRVRCGDGAERS